MIRATPHWRDDRLPVWQAAIVIVSAAVAAWAVLILVIWAALSIVAEALP